MSNIQTNFPAILSLAKDDGMPVYKKRGILREYLQTKFLAALYQHKDASKLSFVGGTSLRILRGLNRFSEDLDFDNLGMSKKDMVKLVEDTCQVFERENIQIELRMKHLGENFYADVRFVNLLYDLDISTNPKEKMMIKVDIGSWWKGQKTEVLLMKRFGIVEQVVTNIKDQLLSQKLTAYVRRNETQPRDMYDVVWLYSQNAVLDYDFLEKNQLSDLLSQAKRKSDADPVHQSQSKRLAPFLFNESDVRKLELFGPVLKEL